MKYAVKMKATNGYLVLGIGIILFLTIGILGIIKIDKSVFKIESTKSFLSGESNSKFSDAFNDSIPIKDKSVSMYASFMYDVFKQAYPGVLIGKDEWLFSTEEFENNFSAKNNIFYNAFINVLKTSEESSFINFVKMNPKYEKLLCDINEQNQYTDNHGFDSFKELIDVVNDYFIANNIKLIVLPIPLKAKIYKEQLGKIRIPQNVLKRYDSICKVLENKQIPYVETEKYFIDYAKNNTDGVFMKYETHWTSNGSELAAKSTASQIIKIAKQYNIDLAKTNFVLEQNGTSERECDLFSFLPLPGTTKRELSEKRTVEVPFYEANISSKEDNSDMLFNEQKIPIAIVGTSYTADSVWNYESFLKYYTQSDVLDLSEPGHGPFIPMAKVLSSGILSDNDVQIVVWEIPERYVPVEVSNDS